MHPARSPTLVAMLLLSLGACAGTCPEPATAPEPAPATAPETAMNPPSTTTPTADANPSSGDAISELCSAEIHRDFDFWLGRWEVHTQDGTLAGHNRIERAHGGCGLIEHWQGAGGSSGTSINYVDPQTQRWVQNWIGSGGSVIQLEGELVAGEMVLEGRFVSARAPEPQRMRGRWTALDDGRVRQFFETSADGGETWTPWFEGFYTRVAD